MNDNSRDTQFKGFAKALIAEMLAHNGGWIDFNEGNPEDIEAYSSIIARRAYDLAVHVCEEVESKEQDYEARITSESMLYNMPDLPELPKEQTP